MDQTIRQEMISMLSEEEMSVRDLSQAVGIREREVYDHLVHIERTVSAQGKKLVLLPIECLNCGYIFKDRKRLTRPSRCPRCKKSHIPKPVYRIE